MVYRKMLDISRCKYCIDKIISVTNQKTEYICKHDSMMRTVDFLDECPKDKKKYEAEEIIEWFE